MYRVALLIEGKGTRGKNFKTRKELDEWLLSMLEKENVKLYRILNKETGEIIEDEQGRRDKKK